MMSAYLILLDNYTVILMMSAYLILLDDLFIDDAHLLYDNAGYYEWHYIGFIIVIEARNHAC